MFKKKNNAHQPFAMKEMKSDTIKRIVTTKFI